MVNSNLVLLQDGKELSPELHMNKDTNDVSRRTRNINDTRSLSTDEMQVVSNFGVGKATGTMDVHSGVACETICQVESTGNGLRMLVSYLRRVTNLLGFLVTSVH